jgi:solute carrier family 25 carnitine/acylcarnitine transporter 20/29
MAEVAKPPDSALKAGVKSFLAGGAGGMSLVFVGHPLDTAKVKLQTAQPGQFTGMVDVFKQTIKSEGVTGLYRGMGAPLCGIAPIFAIYFWGFEQGKTIARNMGGVFTNDNGSISTAGIVFGGGFSAIPGSALMVPGDRIKVMLQATGSKIEGPIAAIKQIAQEGGVRAFYKGTGLTLLRDGPGSMAYYGGYEIAKDALSPADGSKASVGAVLTAGGLAGWANWIVAVPPDVLKSRLQSAPPGKYSGGMAVFREVLAEGGVMGLYKGIGPALVRAFPANAACFLGYETAMSMLNLYW